MPDFSVEWNSTLFASVKQMTRFQWRAAMRIKHALATTSVLALLAGPALAQAPASNSAPAPDAKSGAPAAGGPNVVVQQPAPAVTVKPNTPNVNVQAEKPNVSVTQPPPQVIVKNPEPNVQVQTGQPDVKVLPAEKPNVTVNQTSNKPDVNVGTTAAPDTRAPAAGTAAVAPAAGTFPAAKEVDKFIGKDVYGSNGKKVGELNNLLINPDGQVRAGIVEFGGFLGMGEHKVAVPWNQLNVQGDRLTVNMTEDQIKTAPNWNKDHPNGEFAEYKPYR
jgi:sporulation protein YlmC with PRC-barrel domain